MRFGEPIILECPSCRAAVRHCPLLSGNTFGATYWSDGRIVASMLPDPVKITKCRGCGAVWWLNKAPKGEPQVIRFYQFWRKHPPAPRELSGEEYLDAFDARMAESREEEIFLRIRGWWRENDVIRDILRKSRSKGVHLPERGTRSTENLKALALLLDAEAAPSTLLMRAEIARQLGDMDTALGLLDQNADADCQQAAEQLKAWALAGDCTLKRLGL